jgi:AcrR family transcriptional regulator
MDSPMPRPSIAAERREEILQAFETCALRKGLDATTLADVAEEAGLPRPLVRHFMGNRADMVTGLIERMMSRATQAIEHAIAAADEKRDEEVLQVVLNHTFIDPIANRLMIQLWQQSWQDKKLHTQLEDVYRRCVEQIHDRVFPDATQSTYDLAYALTSLALGNAVFNQFNIHPAKDGALLQAGRAIAQLSSSPDHQEHLT